jgi:spore maturation protein CgeB
MLTERTEEHIQSFEEDKEAGFFSSAEELVKKVRFYLKNNTLREQIATAGRERCLRSGYSNHERIKKMLDEVLEHNDRMGK